MVEVGGNDAARNRVPREIAVLKDRLERSVARALKNVYLSKVNGRDKIRHSVMVEIAGGKRGVQRIRSGYARYEAYRRADKLLVAASEQDRQSGAGEEIGGAGPDHDVHFSVAVEIGENDAAGGVDQIVPARGKRSGSIAVKNGHAGGDDIGDTVSVHVADGDGVRPADGILDRRGESAAA